MKNDKMPTFMRVNEIAKMFSVTNYTARTWIRKGKIPATKVNGQWLVTQEDAVAFAKAQYGDGKND